MLGYGLSHDPFDESFTLRTASASGNLRWQLGPNVTAGLLYGFLDSRGDDADGASTPRVRAHRAALTLGFGKSW
jgi:hypothetical protein